MIRDSDPARWAELCAEFDALVELNSGARADRLVAIGAADPDARRALEELLDADANPHSGLGRIDALFAGLPALAASGRSAELDVLKLAGRTVSHFRVVEPLAAGGMGVVYRAIDTHLGRPVALKFPLPGQHIERQVRERFMREARAAGALDHPNICSIHETGETDDGHLFLAMPLYEGETLKARIARTGPLPIADALAIAVQMARGLGAAHRAGIVHRDLKPANAIILGDGGLKILDFGVARSGDVTLTRSHDTLGTVSYMAPEQIRGESVDARADLWALGVVLYEMVTGRRPFDGQHEIAIAHAIVHSEPVRPSVLRPELPPELDALIMKLLARDPSDRPASADAVADTLNALQSRPMAPAGRRRPFSFTGSGRALPWVAVFAVVVAAGMAATIWLNRPGRAHGSSEPRRVAVLPFEDLSGSEDTDYLIVALADEIATRLSRLESVTVPGEWFMLGYRESERPPLDIADELSADAIVTGVVRGTGDRMQLYAELFDVGERRRVWTRELRGGDDLALAIQQTATGIVTALDLDLTRAERAALLLAPTASAEAYDLYLRGRAAQIGALPGLVGRPQSYSRAQLERLQQAESYYARARESDPAFAGPRARLAMVHLALGQDDRTSARRDQARIEAEAALRLQPGMPEAHEALASYWLRRGELPTAIREIELALAGRPNAPHLFRELGITLRQAGRWEESVSALERATRLDPRNEDLHQQAALTYGRLRRYDKSIAHWERVIALDTTGDPQPRIIRAYNYLRLGNVDSLEAEIRRIPLERDSGGMAARSQGMTTNAHYTLHRIRRRHAEALASLDSSRFAILSDASLYLPVSLLRGQTLERMGNPRAARSAFDAARALLEDSVAAHPREARIHIGLGLAYAGLRRRADAMREAVTATELAPLSDNSPAATAAMGGAVEIYAQLGDTDAALELIELLLAMPAGREISVPLLRLDPTYDPLRSDPRFEALLARFSRN
jgi:serine/threonine-protein kinase